jgi:hypothetical protein
MSAHRESHPERTRAARPAVSSAAVAAATPARVTAWVASFDGGDQRR